MHKSGLKIFESPNVDQLLITLPVGAGRAGSHLDHTSPGSQEPQLGTSACSAHHNGTVSCKINPRRKNAVRSKP